VPRIRRYAVLAAASAVLVGVTVVDAFGHGYSTAPISRAKYCAQGTVTGCGEIQWEPQSVEGPKGFPAAGPADGTICAGGNSRFAQLDDPRGGNWPASRVGAGSNYTFRWTLTAAHATTSFEYYVTRDGWDRNQPLTRAALDPQPFLTVPFGGQRPPFEVSHSGNLPNKSGRHLILGVWTIADTPNAFYQCSDVDFG
jgi:predicted carbohydrate-binding protein with CBM5 and CBM33 domain